MPASAAKKLKAPFPWFGGKDGAAALVWPRLGDVVNYSEPFCGKAAMLLRRPTPGRIETINDVDCYVANFWRATTHDPEDAERLLQYAADVDHYCDERDCSLLTPKCRDMHLFAGLKALRDALEPPHDGLQPSRLTHESERIYAERWKEQNVRKPHVNDGYTLVEWILNLEGRRYPESVSLRDDEVAASVIQWLGTSCGLSFVRECERKIAEARAFHSEWGGPGWVMLNTEPEDEYTARAKALVGCFHGHPGYQQAIREVAAALKHAESEGARKLAGLAESI